MSGDDELRSSLRKKIIEIQQDASLSPQQKAQRVQALMSSNYKPPVEPTPSLEEDLKKTYFDEENSILGCSHYRRNCKLKAFCCERFFTCRLCHDEKISEHKIDRYKTQEVLCMQCGTTQPVSAECTNCHTNFGKYFCSVCKFYDDDPKKSLYHCDQCNMCRVGPQDLYYHCTTCGVCLSKSLEGKHKCREKQHEAVCPICHQPSFTTRINGIYLKCGHTMHSACFDQYVVRNYTCPLCSKSILNTKHIFAVIDQEVAMNRMPDEFSNTIARIYCNDCEKKSDVPFHYVGHKCKECSSYNTRLVKTENMPTITMDPVTRSVTVNGHVFPNGIVLGPPPGAAPPAGTQEGSGAPGAAEGDDDSDEWYDLDTDDDDDAEEGDNSTPTAPAPTNPSQ